MGTNLTVDRSELADTVQPTELAELLINQLVSQLPRLLPLPIEEVAKACGIAEIHPLDTDAFEGGLIQNENKSRGIILIKANARPERSKFTVAHELGHFLNLRHVAAPGVERLLCTREDMAINGSPSSYKHGMEAQANEFAAELLMPRKTLEGMPFLRGSPEIDRILKLQNLCQVSKEAASRRYAQLHGGDFAIVFTKDSKVFKTPIRSGNFPWVDLKVGQYIYKDSLTKCFQGQDGDVSEQLETEPGWWINSQEADRWEMWEEVLIQANGFKLTLLSAERSFTRHDNDSWQPRLR